MRPRSIDRALRDARAVIDRVDARVLLCHATGRDAAYLIAHPGALLSADDDDRYEALVARRAAGEPVAYLTGEREFFGRLFRITPAVLIPRPETERLIELALERLPRDREAAILDLGTGSGCIAITLAIERPRARVQAVDRCAEALDLARENAARLGALNVEFTASSWFSALEAQSFDAIVANPPYVAAGDPHLSEGDLRFEPAGALAGGADGLDDIRNIVQAAPPHLKPDGWLLLEHGYDQAAHVRALMVASGFESVFSAADLAGIQRVTGGRLTRAKASQ